MKLHVLLVLIISFKISISIDKESGEINITNNGGGIDVEKHEEHKIYVPEMILKLAYFCKL